MNGLLNSEISEAKKAFNLSLYNRSQNLLGEINVEYEMGLYDAVETLERQFIVLENIIGEMLEID